MNILTHVYIDKLWFVLIYFVIFKSTIEYTDISGTTVPILRVAMNSLLL